VKQWEPSAARAAADIEYQAAINPNAAVNIATIDGLALVDKWRQATTRAQDRADEAAACHEIMAECRNIAGDPHNSTVDAVRGLLARAKAAEAALAAREAPCFWTRMDADEHGQANWNNVWESTCSHAQTTGPSGAWAFCPYCGQPIEVQP
jgi:hypothetical protein